MSGLMIMMPESPQWYLSNGQNEEAEQSLKQLRQGHITDEFNTFLQAQEQEREQRAANQSTGASAYAGRQFYKPLALSLGLMFFQQFSGINAILFYQTSIYEASVKSIKATHMTIIVCAAQVVATVIGSFLVDRLGRRILLILSGAGHAISLIMFGFYNHQSEATRADISWLALLSLIIFISSFSIGFGPIPWMMVPELSGPQVRSMIASIATSFNWVCVFIVAFSMQPMLNTIGNDYTYWIYALICVVSCVFIVIFIPETKGKTNDQIQRELLGLPTNDNEESAGGNRALKAMA